VSASAPTGFASTAYFDGINKAAAPTDYRLVKKFRMMRFKDGRWLPLEETASKD
jgi:uncharacterized protein YfaT (DUF1175 family)